MGREKQKPTILINSNDKSLFQTFEKSFEDTKLKVEIFRDGKRPFPDSTILVLVDSKKLLNSNNLINWADKNKVSIFISSSENLKMSLENIKQITQNLTGGEMSHDQSIISSDLNMSKNQSNDPCIVDFFEKKLKGFVKRMKDNKGKNLYSLLMKEFEKPLITIILKETQGNQVQAANLLGINRNTLRKKIKDLNLSLEHLVKD